MQHLRAATWLGAIKSSLNFKDQMKRKYKRGCLLPIFKKTTSFVCQFLELFMENSVTPGLSLESLRVPQPLLPQSLEFKLQT